MVGDLEGQHQLVAPAPQVQNSAARPQSRNPRAPAPTPVAGRARRCVVGRRMQQVAPGRCDHGQTSAMNKPASTAPTVPPPQARSAEVVCPATAAPTPAAAPPSPMTAASAAGATVAARPRRERARALLAAPSRGPGGHRRRGEQPGEHDRRNAEEQKQDLRVGGIAAPRPAWRPSCPGLRRCGLLG